MTRIGWLRLEQQDMKGWLLRTFECGINLRSLMNDLQVVGGKVVITTQWTEVWIPSRGEDPGHWARLEQPAQYKFLVQSTDCLEDDQGAFWFRVQAVCPQPAQSIAVVERSGCWWPVPVPRKVIFIIYF